MTAQCQNCSSPARDAFLCRLCTTKLRQMLADCVWWIDRLAEAAIGDTRMSSGTGAHGYQQRYPINGEHNIAHYLATYPGMADDLPDAKAITGRYMSARRQALAAGGVNDRASALLDSINNTLTTMVRDICETRGLPIRNVRAYPPRFIGALQNGAIRCDYHGRTQFAAQWLSEHVMAICAGEDAGQTFSEIQSLTGDDRRDGRICRAINRPIPIRELGRCPTWHEQTRAICGTSLRARADALEVFCHICRVTHKTDRLQLLLISDLARAKVTAAEILRLNRVLPEDYRISERSLRRWRQTETLKRRGFLRPCSCGHGSKYHDRLRQTPGCDRCKACSAYDGREVINQHNEEDEPLYYWEDVRKLRAQQWGMVVTQ
jgi:hypothetical protein